MARVLAMNKFAHVHKPLMETRAQARERVFHNLPKWEHSKDGTPRTTHYNPNRYSK